MKSESSGWNSVIILLCVKVECYITARKPQVWAVLSGPWDIKQTDTAP